MKDSKALLEQEIQVREAVLIVNMKLYDFTLYDV